MENNMSHSLSTKIFRIFVLFVLLFFGFFVSYKHDKTKEMIDWNTKIINSIGVTAFTQQYNSTLLIEILTEMENNEKFTSIVENKDEDIEGLMKLGKLLEEDKKVPASPEQVIRDLQEIDASVRAVASNNLFQRQSLEYILEKVRSKKKVSENEGYYVDTDEMFEERYDEEELRSPSDLEIDNFEWEYIPLASDENE